MSPGPPARVDRRNDGGSLHGRTCQGQRHLKGERANPKEIEGMQTPFLVNMAPRKMAGMVSEGMLLDIGYDDGIDSVIATLEKSVPNGTRLC